MARIPEEELQRLKREVSVERLAEARGVKLSRHGSDLLGLCPFHDDREPSLVVSPKKNLWNCLGACQTGGSPIDWVMRDRGVSFRHAAELLREMTGFSSGSGGAAPRPAAKEKRGGPKTEAEREAGVEDLSSLAAGGGGLSETEDLELLGQVVSYYHQALKESPEALEYLASRGLGHPELIDRFRLGFANRTLGYRLPGTGTKAGREIRGRLQRLGILRPSGHEHFNGSLVIPVFDAPSDQAARVVELYGRKVTRGTKLRKGTSLHLYLPGPHRGVFNPEALVASTEIILCESLIDALTFWCAGYRHVTCSYGINGFTEEMLEAFQGHGTERVLVAYDRDDAGEQAAAKLAETLIAAGIDVYRIQFPRGMDANEYALKLQPATKSLGMAIRQAMWLGKGKAPAVEPGQEQAAGSVAVPESRPAAKEKRDEELSSLAAGSAPEPKPVAKEKKSQEPFPLAAGGEEEAADPAEPLADPEPASPVPASPALEIPVERREQEVVIRLGDRRYRVRGLEKNLSYDVMKVNLLASRSGEGERSGDDGFHVDTLDLYSARQRGSFVKQAALELGVEPRVAKRDVGRVLLKLEELQDEQIRKALAPPEAAAVELSEAEREEALALLRSPDLLSRILEDFEACGVVGEETNKLTGYLAAVSRKLSRPLAVVVQSSSAAGKSALLDAVLAFVPEEERVAYSAMTGQSLFYMGEADLKHKVLAIAEEEGAERASYALKLLQSEGELTIASTGKDPATGRLTTHEYRVEGPVAILLTTTAIDVDEELLNRCLVLSVDEDREQTRAIHEKQRQGRTLEGLLAGEEKRRVTRLHRNAQRLLRSLRVVNPHASELTFLDTQTRTRRDHEKYLALIDSIALLHQHQREVKRVEGLAAKGHTVEYIEVTPSDIETANRLAHEVLGRSLDELPPQTRRLLSLLDERVSELAEQGGLHRGDVRFTRRSVRETLGWSYPQVRTHLDRLVELEYVLVHRGGRGQSFVYELLYDGGGGEEGASFLPGLLGTAASLRGKEGEFDPPLTPYCSPIDPHLRGADSSMATASFGSSEPESRKNAIRGHKEEAASYPGGRRTEPSLFPLAARPGGGR